MSRPEMVFLDVGDDQHEVRFLCPRCQAVMDVDVLETTSLGDATPGYAPGYGSCPTDGCGTTCMSCHRKPGEVHGPHCWDRMRLKVSDPHLVDESDCRAVDR